MDFSSQLPPLHPVALALLQGLHLGDGDTGLLTDFPIDPHNELLKEGLPGKDLSSRASPERENLINHLEVKSYEFPQTNTN